MNAASTASARPVVVLAPPIPDGDDAPASVPAARSLEARARRDGYQLGFPTRLAEQARAIDLAACRRLRCPGCGERGMVGKPYHKAPTMLAPHGGYRVVACCGRCGAGEVV